jgi:hypothetical protein
MCGIFAQSPATGLAQIQAFINDEWPLTLGCADAANPVTALPTTLPATAYYPQTGIASCVDTAGRPMRPSLFITDITADPNCKAGDEQNGGTAYNPVAVFGVWTQAGANATPVRLQPALTYWNLGTGSDPVPTAASSKCPCTQGNCVTSGHSGFGYGTEVRYEAGLIAGHSYRLQVIAHDGDQTQGGDAGEACAIFCAGGGTNCTPIGCAEGCGPTPDGCGGTIDCGPCCVPIPCETACAGSTGYNACHTAFDASQGWVRSCPQADGCGNELVCWCPAE